MPLPLKSGADFYTQEIRRVALQNEGSDLPEYISGSIYFNTNAESNTSGRIRYRGLDAWHSIANLEDIFSLQKQIDEIDFASSSDFRALVARVGVAEGDIDSLEGRTDALEALFSGSNAKVADNALMLGGQLPSYYAQSSVLAQLRSEFDALYKTLNDDTTGVIDTWQEVVDFVNEYSGSEDLSTILAGMNTQIADRYTKAEADGRFLKLTGGTIDGNLDIGHLKIDDANPSIKFANGDVTYGNLAWNATSGLVMTDSSWSKEYTLLHTNNYSDLITTLNGNLSVGGNVILNHGKYIFFRDSTGENQYSVLNLNNNYFTIGEGAAAQGCMTYLFGKSIKFRTGSPLVDAMTIDENGDIHISKNLIVDGEVSAGGAGEEGDEGMGLALLEDWAYYDATKAQALGAVLGKDMYDRIVTLEGRATKVGVIQTLTSGKKIGVIEVDGNSTSLFAPATYAWSEITERPTNLSQFTDDVVSGKYLPLTGGMLNVASYNSFQINCTAEDGVYSYFQFLNRGANLGCLGISRKDRPVFMTVAGDVMPLIHSGNVGDYAMLFLGNSLTDIDANTYSYKAGVYGISNGANTPARYGSVLNLPYRVTGVSQPNYMGQIFIPNGDDTDPSLYFRTSLATEWNPWRKVIDDVIIGDYAALKDGSNASGNWGIDISGNAAKLKSFEKEDANTVNYNGIFTVTSSKSQNVPSTYGVGFQFTSKDNPVAGTNMHWFAQLYSSSLNNLYYRGRINEDDWSDWKTIAFTDQVLLLNGSNKIGAGKYINWEGSNLDAEDYESFGYGIRILTYDTASRNNRGGLSVGTRYGFQLTRLANNDESSLTVRFNDPNNDNAWGDWKTLAFTDSDITGNAATATKLKAAVSLWGNEFDGTQSLTKGIWVGVGNDYNFLSGSSSISAMTVNSSLTNFLIGYGTTQDSRTINTFLDGYNIYFRTGAKQTVMTITNAGKVRIDSSGILDRLLSIGSGGVYVNAALNESPALGSVGSNSLLVGAADYGMQHWVLGNGQGHIQVGRFDGTATAYALNLNPLGGAVNIASADAYTNVLGGLITSSSQNGLGFVGRRIYLASNGKIESSSSMVFDDEYIAVEKRLAPNASNTYSLGTPAYRWSNVYSVNGDFSDRVLINGVSDDGSSALSVTGALKVCRNTSSIDTFLEVTSNDTIVKYRGYDSSDGFCSHDFYSHDKLLLHISATNAESQFYTKLAASGLITASGGLYIPTGQSFKIGEATLSWDSAHNALKVDKSIYSDGEVSAGGAGDEEEGTTTGGGREPWASEPFAVTSTSMTFNHNIGTEDVIVQVYERDATSGHWSLILVDVEIVDNASIALHFGRTETTLHKVIVMG